MARGYITPTTVEVADRYDDLVTMKEMIVTLKTYVARIEGRGDPMDWNDWSMFTVHTGRMNRIWFRIDSADRTFGPLPV